MKQLPCNKRVSLAGGLCAASLMILLAGITEVSAQFMGRGAQLEPEQQEAVWTMAARGVAHDLGLSVENTSQLIDAYIAARESYDAARAEMMGSFTPGGDMPAGGMPGGGAPGEGMRGGGFAGGGMFGGQNLEFVTAERDKLEEALQGFLGDEQVAEALESLGTFSSDWDNLLNVIVGFELEDETLFEALAAISKYIVDLEETTANAMANQDFQTMTSARQTLKTTLDGAMAGILRPSQFITWTTETATRTRGAGGAFPGGGF